MHLDKLKWIKLSEVKTLAEDRFTRKFKHNLAENLNSYFHKEEINLDARKEYRTYVGDEENRIDIAIPIYGIFVK